MWNIYMLLENVGKTEELIYDRNISKKITIKMVSDPYAIQTSRCENMRTNFPAGYREYASFFSELQ